MNDPARLVGAVGFLVLLMPRATEFLQNKSGVAATNNRWGGRTSGIHASGPQR